jgi:hypothetical protein
MARRQEALFAVATSPMKQAGMMAFMMYMAGSQLGIFSIMATFNGIYQPATAILNSGAGERPRAPRFAIYICVRPSCPRLVPLWMPSRPSHLLARAVFVPDPERKLNVTIPRLVYCLIHAAALAFALYRIHLMGLLPTSMADWVWALQAPIPTEHAVAGLL